MQDMGSPILSSEPPEYEGWGEKKDKILNALVELDGGPATAPEIADFEYISVKRRAILNHLQDLEEEGIVERHELGRVVGFSLVPREPTIDELTEYIRDLSEEELESVAAVATEERNEGRVDLNDPSPNQISMLLEKLDPDGRDQVRFNLNDLRGADNPTAFGPSTIFVRAKLRALGAVVSGVFGLFSFFVGALLFFLLALDYLSGNLDTIDWEIITIIGGIAIIGIVLVTVAFLLWEKADQKARKRA